MLFRSVMSSPENTVITWACRVQHTHTHNAVQPSCSLHLHSPLNAISSDQAKPICIWTSLSGSPAPSSPCPSTQAKWRAGGSVPTARPEAQCHSLFLTVSHGVLQRSSQVKNKGQFILFWNGNISSRPSRSV